MTAAQSLKIFEILNQQFGQPEAARQVVEAIEAVVDEKVVQQTREFERIVNKDIEALRLEMRFGFENAATKQELMGLEIKIVEVKAELLRWMIVLFTPFYVGMIVFLIKQFV